MDITVGAGLVISAFQPGSITRFEDRGFHEGIEFAEPAESKDMLGE
jgi:hypothetical protein